MFRPRKIQEQDSQNFGVVTANDLPALLRKPTVDLLDSVGDPRYPQGNRSEVHLLLLDEHTDRLPDNYRDPEGVANYECQMPGPLETFRGGYRSRKYLRLLELRTPPQRAAKGKQVYGDGQSSLDLFPNYLSRASDEFHYANRSDYTGSAGLHP